MSNTSKKSAYHPELRRSVILFFTTLICVFYVFGSQWLGGNPFTELSIAFEAGKFSITLMAILLAHEMGHYWVAKRHGFELSLPVFIPVPFAFGTLGAVIQLRSLPSSRSALLEMGAAGPLAGFVLSIIAFCIGLPFTEDVGQLQIQVSALSSVPEPGAMEWLIENAAWVFWPLEQLESLLQSLGTVPQNAGIPIMILADPPLLQGIGWVLLGEVPSRYASLDPIAFAGWVGCMLTAMNLLPIGQLDGGHICNACFPRYARRISIIGIISLLLFAFIWPGWFVWALALIVMRAWVSLPLPQSQPLTKRAKQIVVATLIAFGCCFMPRPVMLENISIEDIVWLDDKGLPTEPPLEFKQ